MAILNNQRVMASWWYESLKSPSGFVPLEAMNNLRMGDDSITEEEAIKVRCAREP
jgi:hypothetical protein